MGVEHARHTIESEAIKGVLVHPEPQVAEQEPHNLVMTVVEKPAVPELVLALGATMEVLVIGTVKLIQAIKDVLGGVTVDDVEQHNNAQGVGSIHQLLEILGRAVSAAGSEEAVHLITETGIVGVLHDGHELNGVVSQVLDAGKHVLCELFISSHLALRGGNADVGLVDPKALGLRGPLVLECVSFGLGRVPEPRLVCGRD